MKAKERLYLTLDKKTVVTHSRHPKTLLCGEGCKIPDKYIPLVQAFYATQTKPLPKAATTAEVLGDAGDAIENRETRVPKSLSKRKSK